MSTSEPLEDGPADRARPAASASRWRYAAPVAIGLALVHPACRLLAFWDWRADLFTHFQGPAFGVTLAAMAFLVAIRRRRLALALAVLAVFQAEPFWRYRGANPVSPAPGSERVRVLMANVLHVNDDYAALRRLIDREQPDIVGLVEVSPEWSEGLEREGIRALYPHGRVLPWGARGLALLFRRPPEEFGPIEIPLPDGNPALTARFPLGGRSRTIWLVHPPNPLTGAEHADRDLAALGERIGRDGGSRLVVGDLNRTDGSPHFFRFLRAIGLRDSRYGFGPQPTWPTWSPLRIAIDHAFLSDDLAVVSRRVGPKLGSDHFPLILDVSPAERRSSRRDFARSIQPSP